MHVFNLVYLTNVIHQNNRVKNGFVYFFVLTIKFNCFLGSSYSWTVLAIFNICISSCSSCLYFLVEKQRISISFLLLCLPDPKDEGKVSFRIVDMCLLVNKPQRFKVFESPLRSLWKLWISSYNDIWHDKQLQDTRHKLQSGSTATIDD